MSDTLFDRRYWEGLYAGNGTTWDIGYCSTPLRTYFDQLTDRDLRILIPGGGRAYEAEHLHRNGFRNVHVMDLTDAPFVDLLERCPDFPPTHLIVGDFFQHAGRYDRIIEQTFFCALHPGLRAAYVEQAHALLAEGGKLVGVLFDDPLNTDRPPFGGDRDGYLTLFAPVFQDISLEPCHNSIKPRAGRELWLSATRTTPY
jgi:methyl halide transferase